MEQYLEEHIESAIRAVFVCANFHLVPNHIFAFTSLDTSSTWNVNRPATKTSTRDTFSALPGLEKKFGQKLVARSYFRGHKIFANFEHVF